MRIWTIQPISVWQQICEGGKARVEATRWSTPEFTPPSYEWLRGQLCKRLDAYEGRFPWWCYCAKPDLRVHRHGHLCGGQKQVRLELDIEPARVQRFRIWAWNQVYCGKYLGTRRQERDWKRRRRLAEVDPDLHDAELGEPWRSELKDSWQRLFDELPTRKNDAGQASGYEAVVEVLTRDDVRRVDEFRTTYESFEAHIAAIKKRYPGRDGL